MKAIPLSESHFSVEPMSVTTLAWVDVDSTILIAEFLVEVLSDLINN